MKIPKLDDQDDFLISLQNNNYSPQTILNYARDLCIFAVFIHFRDIPFMKIQKKDISGFKGYLIAGQHLKDLDKIREEYAKSVGKMGLNNGEAPRGSLRPMKDSDSVDRPGFEGGFLFGIYKKVYGSLGLSVHPSRRSRSKNEGLDPNSINRMLSALRSYLKFRIEWNLEIPLPPDAIDMMKAEKRVKKVAGIEELIKLIESPMEFEKDEKVALRNRCMLEMLFATGMRISELMGIDLKDINSEGKMYILGKGQKERSIFMTERSLRWLNNYLKIRLRYAFTEKKKKEEVISGGDDIEIFMDGRETVPQNAENEEISDLNLEIFDNSKKYIQIIEKYRENGYLEKFDSPALFIPFSGGRDGKHSDRLSTNYFQEKIVEYRRKLGIQIPTSAHSLRHGFATYLAEQGASPVALQVLLGHSSLNTTTKYVHASEKFAEETVKQHHPLK